MEATHGLAKLAGNTPFLARRVSAERMLTAKPWRDRALLERIHNCVRRSEELLEDDIHSPEHLGHEEKFTRLVERGLSILPGCGGGNAGSPREGVERAGGGGECGGSGSDQARGGGGPELQCAKGRRHCACCGGRGVDVDDGR